MQIESVPFRLTHDGSPHDCYRPRPDYFPCKRGQ
jgi:hypothetical protein